MSDDELCSWKLYSLNSNFCYAKNKFYRKCRPNAFGEKMFGSPSFRILRLHIENEDARCYLLVINSRIFRLPELKPINATKFL